MEGRPMVSYSIGSINSLVEKLTKLKNSQPTAEGLQQEHIGGLLQVLKALDQDFLRQIAGGRATNGQVQAWMKQVRKLAYDFEDSIDWAMNTEGRLESQKFEDFKIQIQEACGRRKRYDLPDKAPTDPVPLDLVRSKGTTESRLLWEGERFGLVPHVNKKFGLVPQRKKFGLVALDKAQKDLIVCLTDNQNQYRKLKVVSIVGVDGLGKTTLAKEIHAELEGQFECQAFVTVSWGSSIRTILRDMLYQVNPFWNEMKSLDENDMSSVAVSESEGTKDMRIMTSLQDYLCEKRYFISIDGVRSTWDWKVLNCALPDNNRGSRVLITTCNFDVAKSCSNLRGDVIYKMESLSDYNSRILLRSRIPVGKADKLVEDDILSMCGGIPLAIIIAAGLLPKKYEELAELKMLGKSIFSSPTKYSTSEGTKRILCMSFADLSLPVQSCFLYLSVFPENYIIKKDRMIRLWGAEGFILRTDKEGMWETGEKYFDELVSRRLIQMVFDNNGEAVGCTVEGVILDFITSLSREEDFVTVGAELRSELYPCDIIRRFSFHHYSEEEAYTKNRVDLTRVRSLILFSNVNRINDLSSFQLVRVLDLEDIYISGGYHMKKIGSLFLLTYLALASTGVTSDCIKEIGGLQHLKTLDLRKTLVTELPSCINSILVKLVSLLGNGLCFSHVNHKAVSYKYMEELSTIDISKASSNDSVAKVLNRSQRLRILGVRGYGTKNDSQNIIFFLDKLKEYNIESLAIESHLLDEWAPWPGLRRIQLENSLPRVPHSWSEREDLALTHLDIKINQIDARDLLALGRLRNLIVLKLFSQGYEKDGCIVSSVGFQCLEEAWFRCPNDGMGLQFSHKAMPRLLRLRLAFNAGKTKESANGFKFGIQFPSSLEEVHVTINCKDSTMTNVDAAVVSITDQISCHPRKPNPSLVLVKHGESLMKSEGVFPSEMQEKTPLSSHQDLPSGSGQG